MKKPLYMLIAVLLLVSGCGALNYSQTYQQDYKAKAIAVFPVETGIFAESAGVVDKAAAQIFVDKGWFEKVFTAEDVKARLGADAGFKKAFDEYSSKLKLVNYSDPALSGRLGRDAGVECFLLSSVEQWTYLVENDKKIARVGLSFRLIDARTGADVWKAAHTENESYVLLKPELADVSRRLAARIIAQMPH